MKAIAGLYTSAGAPRYLRIQVEPQVIVLDVFALGEADMALASIRFSLADADLFLNQLTKARDIVSRAPEEGEG